MGVGDLTWFDVVAQRARERGARPAVICEGETVTHAEALGRAERLAAGLAAAGIGHGDRIAVLAQNRPEYLDVVAAASRLGAICVLVNWRLGPEEVAYVLADGDSALVLAEPDYAALVPEGPARYAFGTPPSGWTAYDTLVDGPAPPLGPTGVAGSDPLVIIHTAAVDGKPRGAVLTQANLIAQNLQLAAAWSLVATDVGLVALPLFHVSGLGLALAVQGAGGASVVMRRFEAPAAVAAIAARRVTVLCEFAPMLGQILDATDTPDQLASLKAVWGLDSHETIVRFEAACPDARFWSGYGQSETSGFVTFAPHRERPGSAGRAAPLAALAIVDEDDRPVPDGTVGEIVVRGPLVFAGYWRREADTAHAFRGGQHHTGDMGRFDPDGYLFYAGRSPAKELIKSGGENVYPAEVERALREHPDVEGAVVFGVPDPRWGEAVVAICARRTGAALEADQLIAFVGERIARYKRPKTITFVETLPTTAAGVVDRARVKAEHGAA